MKSQGIIYHGSNSKIVLDEAYKALIGHMVIGSKYDPTAIRTFVLNGTYPNFFHLKRVEGENEISVDASREVINFLSQKPTLLGNRAVLIENFEDMSRNAANSILKILEEPPIDSILVLTTEKLLSVLPTIRSRCIKIRVNCEIANHGDFEGAGEFSKKLLYNISENLVQKFIEFIDKGCRGGIEFSKQNAEYFEEFLKVAMAYCSFVSSKKADLGYARKLLELQAFSDLSRNTYPDKQSGIIAICEILKTYPN